MCERDSEVSSLCGISLVSGSSYESRLTMGVFDMMAIQGRVGRKVKISMTDCDTERGVGKLRGVAQDMGGWCVPTRK